MPIGLSLYRATRQFKGVAPVGRPFSDGGSGQEQVSSAVHSWLDSVVLKHALCPWAHRSLRKGGLRIVTSSAFDEPAVRSDIMRERKRLFRTRAPGHCSGRTHRPPKSAWH